MTGVPRGAMLVPMSTPQNLLVEDQGDGTFRETHTSSPAIRHDDGRGPPTKLLKFSGAYEGSNPSTHVVNLEDQATGIFVDAGDTNLNTGYPMPPGTAKKLRAQCSLNTFGTAITVFVARGGSPTGITLTIPAGSEGVAVADLTHEAEFTEGQALSVRASTAGNGDFRIYATLEYAAS